LRQKCAAADHKVFGTPEKVGLKVQLLMKKVQRQMVLSKGGEKFIFRYEAGREDELLDALVGQARDKRTSFDWFDAAVLSFKLTQLLVGQAEELLRDSSDMQCASKLVN
jgi:hypothetical protein